MAQFATAADLAELLGETFDATRTAQANAALELASATIQGWTRQTIELVAGDTVTLRGTWDEELVLPQRPVVAVTAVSVDGTALTADDWRLWGSSLVRVGYGNWAGPDVAVAVTYSHGWAVIPDVIRAVTMQIAVRLMANPGLVQAESIGTYSVTYGSEAGGGGALTIDEQALLGPFRRRTATVPIR